jgi:hypothetical protein
MKNTIHRAESKSSNLTASQQHKSSTSPARPRARKAKQSRGHQRIRVYIPKPMADAVATAAKIEGIDQGTFIARAAQAKVARHRAEPIAEQGRAPDAITTLRRAHQAASQALIEQSQAAGRVDPLIAFEGMIFGDPWCSEICIGDHLHIDERDPLPGELIIIEDARDAKTASESVIRVHRLVSFDGKTWTLRSRRGQLVRLPATDAYYVGVVIAITQIRTIEVDRKTFDPWDELQGPCVGFVAPDPSTCSKPQPQHSRA